MLNRLIIIFFLSLSLVNVSGLMAANGNNLQKESKAEKKIAISKGSAINAAKNEVRGKVLSADLIKSKGPAVYRIKVLVKDSRVRTVFVDGQSGKVIRIN